MTVAAVWSDFVAVSVVVTLLTAAYLGVGGVIAWRAFDVPTHVTSRDRRWLVAWRGSRYQGRYLGDAVARAYAPPRTRRDDLFILFVHSHPLGRLRKYLDGKSDLGPDVFTTRR